MSANWITDRMPTEGDCAAPHYCVYDSMGSIVHYKLVGNDEPWRPVPKCEPYKEPRRFILEAAPLSGLYRIYDLHHNELNPHTPSGYVAEYIPTREAAERIAAIYEEMMP